MKILIATGIFPPEVGGPATYAAQLAQKLTFPDGEVRVITFAPKDYKDQKKIYDLVQVPRSGNRFIDRITFFRAIKKIITDPEKRPDLIYTLDWFAAGLPVAIAARFSHIPYVVRVGGDYLWEQRYLESNEPPVPLEEFYALKIHRRMGYRPFYLLIRWILRGAAHVIFNTDTQRKLYERHYGLTKTSTIYNAVPKMTVHSRNDLPIENTFVFWGRFIVMKNVTALVRAFAQARIPSSYQLLLIGNGPRKREVEMLISRLGIQNRVRILDTLPQAEVWNRVKDTRALVVPSWTDISPHTVYEALALQLPALITKENYLSIYDQLPMMIDPGSDHDIAEKLEMLADDEKYKDFSAKFNSIHFEHTWDDVAKEHEAVFKKVV